MVTFAANAASRIRGERRPARLVTSEEVAESRQKGAQVGRAFRGRAVRALHIEPFVGVSNQVPESGGLRQALREVSIDKTSVGKAAKGVAVALGCTQVEM